MSPLASNRILLKKQFAAFMDTAKAIMTQLETEAKADNTSALPSVAIIQRTVADHFKLPATVMASRIRTNSYVTPRHIAMVLSRELTNHTIEGVAHSFLRDHGTVIHACKSVASRAKTEPQFAETLALLRARCENALMEESMPLFSETP